VNKEAFKSPPRLFKLQLQASKFLLPARGKQLPLSQGNGASSIHKTDLHLHSLSVNPQISHRWHWTWNKSLILYIIKINSQLITSIMYCRNVSFTPAYFLQIGELTTSSYILYDCSGHWDPWTVYILYVQYTYIPIQCIDLFISNAIKM
jgi:hypothetical protein